jgi:SPP1 family predicted phage head-tail adaptor
MQAGNLRHKVEIQEAVKVRNTTGARPTQWQSKGFARMAVEPVRGAERQAFDIVSAGIDVKFIARFRPWITAEHRLIFDGQTYDIEEIIDIRARRRSLEILAKRAA